MLRPRASKVLRCSLALHVVGVRLQLRQPQHVDAVGADQHVADRGVGGAARRRRRPALHRGHHVLEQARVDDVEGADLDPLEADVATADDDEVVDRVVVLPLAAAERGDAEEADMQRAAVRQVPGDVEDVERVERDLERPEPRRRRQRQPLDRHAADAATLRLAVQDAGAVQAEAREAGAAGTEPVGHDVADDEALRVAAVRLHRQGCDPHPAGDRLGADRPVRDLGVGAERGAEARDRLRDGSLRRGLRDSVGAAGEDADGDDAGGQVLQQSHDGLLPVRVR